ncbi:MAG: hypothetical protein WCG45_02840 [bacterium]
MIFKKIKKNEGYSLIEMIFYIALFAMLTTVIINSMMTMIRSFKEVSIKREITQGAEIMERISREIKQANKINTIDTPGGVKLDSKDESGTYKLVEFALTDKNIRILENSNFIGNLNSPNIEVDTLTFNKITTIKGEAIRVLLTVSSKHDYKNRSFNYQNTVVLRGDY